MTLHEDFMAFTTWTALYNAMLDILTSGDASVGSVTVNGKTITYKSNKEFLDQLEFVKRQSDAESGAFVSRTYARQGGRGV
jgi:chorismate-pyruvate lyase